MNPSRYLQITSVFLVLLAIVLLLFGNLALFILANVTIFVFVFLRTLLTPTQKRIKFALIIAYAFVFVLQNVVCVQIAFAAHTISPLVFFIHKLIGVLFMLLPLLVSHYLLAAKYAQFYLPPLGEIASLSFSQLKSSRDKITENIGYIHQAGQNLSPDNLKTLIADLPRHDSFNYVNNGTLTEAYFSEAQSHCDDAFLYIVISNTGSPASELISIFTQKQYNHASLAFDCKLKTIISYNGGERVYPPGLNHEMLAFFNKKEDASIMVYKLPCTPQQKQKVLDKVREINEHGSAYNLLGLIIRYSHKPNIMFCSQFVYRMLEYAGLNYFEKKDGHVHPTDFIEMDYHRKLIFDYEIFLNQNLTETQQEVAAVAKDSGLQPADAGENFK